MSLASTRTSTYDPEEYEARLKRKYAEEYRDAVRQKRSEQLKRAIEHSGLGLMLHNKTFDSYEATEDWQKIAKGSCEKYAANPDKWLLLSGPSGCGKTHLCTAVAGSMIRRQIPVWYMLYREEIDSLKAMDGVDPEARERRMRIYKTAHVLYIDDLFKASATKADIKAMFELIDYRYRMDKKTIISTELDIKQLTEIDSAIAGRIIEKSKKVLIKHENGRNYRLKIKE